MQRPMSKFVLLLAFLPALLVAQNDSTLLLAPERLTERDILPRDLSQKRTLAISATRSLDAVDDSPFTILVFTAEDILRNGFVTLTDVLKAAPGIRVSQPGNAVEGETFMVRGLSGNQYMKILINDIPIKPTVALGMPIGAQLPIRQAERIEILYGPAAAIYGDETCAGVVNIILKESERPVYTQADLGFGRFGYNSLDLMFGGKIGKDKKIFRFSLYGSSTVRESMDVFYDQSLYNTNQYLPFGLDSRVYQLAPNFRYANGTGDSLPRTSQLPHESRMFGINLTWRGLHFTYHRMLRSDHSALGISPLAMGYANPSNRIAERIESFSLGFQRQRKRRTSYTNFSFLNYWVDNNSSTTYVFDRLSAANFLALGGPGLKDSTQQELLQNLYSKYASEERFSAARGFELRADSRMSVLIGKKKRLQFDAGAYINLAAGTPLSTYYSVPVDLAVDGIVSPAPLQPLYVSSIDAAAFNLCGFTQLAWRGKRLHVVGGGSASVRIAEGAAFSPRLGALYRLDSSWTVRANVATGIRHAAMYGSVQTYRIVQPNMGPLNLGNLSPKTEQNYATELALRFTSRGGASVEGILFWQEAHNLYRPGYLVEEPGIVYTQVYGYQNAPGLALSMWGVQGVARTKGGSTDLRFNEKRQITLYSRTELYVQFARGKEWFGYNFEPTDEVRNQPKWHTQFRYYFKAGKKFELVIAANQQSSTLGKSFIFKELYQLPEQPRLKKFSTWDFMSRLYLSNHFLVYFQLINVFDRHHAGIDATGTPDDLLYNPQQGRQWRLGVNYNMN